MNAMRRHFATAILVAVPAALGAQELTFPELDVAAPAGTGVVTSCAPAGVAGGSRCGLFRVWEDRERGAGRVVDIAFVVLEATGPTERASDALILLPGGPGQTFTDAAAGVAAGHADLRRTRDILLVDVRGVGRSNALDCDVPYPDGLSSRFGTVFPPTQVAACRDSLGTRANLTLYTTSSSVDDMEELRAWLGYPQLNLLGTSYGTRVAQVYMRRHPASVRTAVLNGVAPISSPLYVQHARLLQRSLDRLVAQCAADETCRSAYPDFRAKLDSTLQRFRAGPVEVEIAGERVPFSLGDFAYALRGLLYNRARDVPRLIDVASAGDVLPLAQYYVARTAWVGELGGSAGYHYSVLCAEDIAPLTDDDVARETAGTFMAAHLIDGYRSVCDAWPYARLPASHWTPVRSEIPVLLLSGSLDPVTPPEGGDEVAQHLTSALHIVVPGGGHGVGGPCIRAVTFALIESGSLDGIDISCIPNADRD